MIENERGILVTAINEIEEKLPGGFLATVGAVHEDGLSLIIDGQTTATTKHYKCNTSATFKAGDRVKVARLSGSYVVEYVVGPPASGGTQDYPDRILYNGYGVRMGGKKFALPVNGDEFLGATDVCFAGGCFNGLYVVFDQNRFATLACNNAGKLVVNGTVIA